MLSGINAGGCEFSRLVSTAIDKPTVLNAAEDKALEKSGRENGSGSCLKLSFSKPKRSSPLIMPLVGKEA